MTKLTFSNVDEVKPGYTVFYCGVPGYAEVIDDEIVVNGKTLTQILEENSQVYFVK